MYSNTFELPTQVRNSLDEDDQKVWMDTFNKCNPQTVGESYEAYKKAWHACKELPSSFSFRIKASMDMVDKDREIIDLNSVKKNMDAFIKHNGNIQYEHGNYGVGAVWDWKPIKENGVDGIEVYGNLFGGDLVYDRMRKAFINGTNSMSVAGEADKGKYQCDERGCYIRRNVTSLMEISLCTVPANKGCTLSWYHEGKSIAKSASDVRLNVDEYEIHKSYHECPFLNLRKSLRDIGYDAHATALGVTVDMSKEEFDRTLPYMKSHNLSAIWSDGSALINDRDYLIEISYKDGVAKGYISEDGVIQSSISKSQFETLLDRDVLCKEDGVYRIDYPRC